MSEQENPLDVQVGGDHYKNLKIQPVEFNHANGLDFFQGSVVKYVTRFRHKNGEADLDKAIHFLQLLKELEYGNKDGENSAEKIKPSYGPIRPHDPENSGGK